MKKCGGPLKVLFSGDAHGEFALLSGAASRLRPDAVIVAGDFGYWREADLMAGGREGVFLHEAWRRPRCKVFFCDGNHENHALLQALVREKGWEKPIRIGRGLYYCPRGSALSLRGRRILFMGGAFSIDRALREPGRTWFPEEEITQEELERVLSRKDLERFDAVVSHTCPESCLPEVCAEAGISLGRVTHRASERALQRLLERMPQVRDWYFGHWHLAMDFSVPGCRTRFHLLNQSAGDRALQGWGWRQETMDAAADAAGCALIGEDA